ncbi:putative zinc-binding protein [Methanogenium organophilum]|uniref:Zinc-binding protein n=1 Tax=Methanogenium organophilum TaxID=2199 RepID=A0A9X9T6A7_METOG|nr:putative zinc-binding protein [Methanogenium organophilum]WAI00203.1 putative zinc-binding protein [Methanogenium organophilum]
MTDDESPVVLVTCSGISNTGKCTTRAAVQLRQRNPDLIDYHIAASGEGSMAVLEGLDPGSLRVIVIDGCEDFCGRKKAEQCGLVPAGHVVATDCGVVKSGMDEPKFADIEALCRAVKTKMHR